MALHHPTPASLGGGGGWGVSDQTCFIDVGTDADCHAAVQCSSLASDELCCDKRHKRQTKNITSDKPQKVTNINFLELPISAKVDL